MRKLILLICFTFANSVLAGDLTIPNSFTAGTPAVAAEVNSNFTAVESAVDDNDARITTNAADISTNTDDIAANTADINSNDSRILAIEGGITIAVDCSADASAFLNTTIQNNTTYTLTGMCDGPISINRSQNVVIEGDDTGTKDDGIILPPGLTENYVINFRGPVAAQLDNLTISAANYTSGTDGENVAGVLVESNASVRLSDVAVVGGDVGVLADHGDVVIGAGVQVTGFREGGLLAGRGAVIYAENSVTVTGGTGIVGTFSEALSAFNNSVIEITDGGSFTGGTDDGSNPDYESYSVAAQNNGTIRVHNSGTVALTGDMNAARSSVIWVQTGAITGAIFSHTQSDVRIENMTHTGGIISIYSVSGFRADNSTLSSGSSELIDVGDMSHIRLVGSTVGNASGTANIELYRFGLLVLKDTTDLGNRDVDCYVPFHFSQGDAINIGTVTC